MHIHAKFAANSNTLQETPQKYLIDIIPCLYRIILIIFRFSVIIVNWNEMEQLRQCLTSLFQYSPPFPYQVIVVDNASEDGSVAMVRNEFPQVRLVVNEANVGFAGGNNRGFVASRGEYILLLNNDAEVMAGTLAALVAFMESHPPQSHTLC